jgi:tetratricopeptide (TPR) repeat protein
MAVEYLHGLRGYAALRGLIEAMRSGASDARALSLVMGQTAEEFQRGWRKHLKDLQLKPRAGLSVPRLTFRVPGKRRRAEPDLEQIVEERARRHARLGGLLRARRRLLAASLEYQRGQAIVGKEDPVLANRLARTYLEMGDHERALAAAAPAMALYPELPGPFAVTGEAFLARKDYARAGEHLLAALRISPFDPRVHCGLWEVYKQQGPSALGDREHRFCTMLQGDDE